MNEAAVYRVITRQLIPALEELAYAAPEYRQHLAAIADECARIAAQLQPTPAGEPYTYTPATTEEPTP